LQLNLQGTLIDLLQKTKAKNIVNLKRRPDQMLGEGLKGEVLFSGLYLCFICDEFNKTLCLIRFARTINGHCQRKCQSRGEW